MKTKFTFRNLPKDDQGLLSLHMLRPIHDQIGYENALEITDGMAAHTLTVDQEDYFEALSPLIEAYESSREALPSKGGYLFSNISLKKTKCPQPIFRAF